MSLYAQARRNTNDLALVAIAKEEIHHIAR